MLLSFAAVLALTAAADQPAPANDKQKILDPGYFDIALCAPQKPELPAKVNKQVLQGVVQLARPQLLECMVDPKARGPEKQSKIVIDASLTDSGVQSKVSGANLTPDGIACVQKALDAWTAQFPVLTAKNASTKDPVAAHLEFTHASQVQPAATLGQNEASDITAQIRLAQPSWCDCYADLAPHGAPHAAFKGSYKVTKPKQGDTASPTDVTFEPTDAAGDKVAGCLKGKIAAMKVKVTEDLQVPIAIKLLNSNATEPLAGATPQLQFLEYDLMTNAQSARIFLTEGARIDAAEAYNSAGDAYNKHAKGSKMTLADVVAVCNAMVKADDAEVAETQALTALFKKIHDFTAELKAKDPSWANAEAAAAQRITAGDAQLAQVQKVSDADKARCAKLNASEEPAPKAAKGSKKSKK